LSFRLPLLWLLPIVPKPVRISHTRLTMTTATPAILNEAVLHEALTGLTSTPQKTLAPWLFYDERGSQLFEEITTLPEYYLTRTERALFAAHADDIFLAFAASPGAPPGSALPAENAVTIAELGAGTATKTGLLLQAATRFQPEVLYRPIDVSPSALQEAAASLSENIPGVVVQPQVANYVTQHYTLHRPHDHRILALYIGSSIGNFSPTEARSILRRLRSHLAPGDALLLGTDLAPGQHKSIATMLAAYDDAAGVTAAFNKNILARLNRELDADFNLDAFAHRARWNAPCSRIEMHLECLLPQTVHIAGQRITFARGETIHTENSHKFTDTALAALLASTGFAATRTFHDPNRSFAVTLAHTV
jgi:L-histidine N-alpha-methyltransferase